MTKNHYNAVIVGSGPNGLATAIELQKRGLQVLLIEGKDSIGGGLRTKELTLSGFRHDICATSHPLSYLSPYFSQLPLNQYGLEYIFPNIPLSHPSKNGNTVSLFNSYLETAHQLGVDSNKYIDLVSNFKNDFRKILEFSLSPLLNSSQDIFSMYKFGMLAICPATVLLRKFKSENLKTLWAGLAAHSVQPLSNIGTSAIALILLLSAHEQGWPIIKGGSQNLANALGAYFESLGGEIKTNVQINSLNELPKSDVIVLDLVPKEILRISDGRFSKLFKYELNQYKYGMGVFKLDWALNSPIPFKSSQCREAGIIHIGENAKKIVYNETITKKGIHPEDPFVILAQQSLFDSSRAPKGKHTAWAYCHVPNSSTKDMTNEIESQIEVYAPGFKETIIERHKLNTTLFEQYNPNYVGGDIMGGSNSISQIIFRPTFTAALYKTSDKKIYICSAATPPGGGVHGMCGFNAANRILQDIFI